MQSALAKHETNFNLMMINIRLPYAFIISMDLVLISFTYMCSIHSFNSYLFWIKKADISLSTLFLSGKNTLISKIVNPQYFVEETT